MKTKMRAENKVMVTQLGSLMVCKLTWDLCGLQNLIPFR